MEQMSISAVPNVFSFERHSELVFLLRISPAFKGERRESLNPLSRSSWEVEIGKATLCSNLADVPIESVTFRKFRSGYCS
jgi:hypothetical protein